MAALLALALLTAGCAEPAADIGEDVAGPGAAQSPQAPTADQPDETATAGENGPSGDAGGGGGRGDAGTDDTAGDGGDGAHDGGSGRSDDGAGEADGGDGAGSATDDGGQARGGIATRDLGGVGANGRAILHRDVPRLVVEVDTQEGVSPGRAPLDHLLATLRAHADKPGGIRRAGGNTFASRRTTWTADGLRAVAEANRSNYSGDGTVAIYVLYVRGEFSDDQAVGVAHNASEYALFPDRWQGAASLVGGDQAVERAVLVHELGHLLGLVNLTYDSRRDHEDPDHPGHSSSRGSVMYWAVESTLVGQVFNGPPPDEFDADDRADMDLVRSGG